MNAPEPRLPAAARVLLRIMTPPLHRESYEAEVAEEAARIRAARGRIAGGFFLLRELGGTAAAAVRERISAEGSAPRLAGGAAIDLRLAARRLRASPAFVLAAVLTLALSVAITSSVFGVVDALFLRPLPYTEADRLVAIWETGRGDRDITTVAPGNVLDWRREAGTLSDIAWFNGYPVTLSADGGAERVMGSVASVNLFEVLGVRPALGTGFLAGHAGEGDAPPARVVVLAHGFWLRQFGGDAGVIGQRIELNDQPYEVVGVMPAGFRHPATFLGVQPAELWIPIRTGGERNFRFLHVVGRIAPGRTIAHARAELAALGDALARAYPEQNGGRSIVVRTVEDQIFGEQKPVLTLLLGAATLVLLVSCANMANLLLARGLARGREFAVRAALGSGRGSLMRLVIAEALVLALLGGLVGVGILVAGQGALRGWAASHLNPLADVHIDSRVAIFTMAIALGSGMLFGVVPALRLTRADLRGALTMRGDTGGGSRVRARLVAAEAALTVVLVFGTVLLGRSLLRTLKAEAGFAVDGTLFFSVRPPVTGYQDQPAVRAFYDRLQASLEARPEIERVGMVSDIPLTSENRSMFFTLPASDQPAEELGAEFHEVSPGYFAAAGIRMLDGRDFSPGNAQNGGYEVIVNRVAARRFWGERSPVGEFLRARDADVDVEVVGVVESTADDAFDSPHEPRLYLSAWQTGARTLYIVARTRGRAEDALPLIRPLVAEIDPRVPVSELATMRQHVAASTSRPRNMTWITALFGAIALLLAAVGTYGVVAYSVTEQKRELGLRSALGARGATLVRHVLGDSARTTTAGIAAGVLLALAGGRVAAGQLPGVPSWDPASLAAAVLTVALAAAFAAWLPARRAARVDPLVAMRE